jgi:hypothetical protein
MYKVARAGTRQRDARREHSLSSVTDEQQGWRVFGAATVKANRLTSACFVSLRSQSAAFVAHRS